MSRSRPAEIFEPDRVKFGGYGFNKSHIAPPTP